MGFWLHQNIKTIIFHDALGGSNRQLSNISKITKKKLHLLLHHACNVIICRLFQTYIGNQLCIGDWRYTAFGQLAVYCRQHFDQIYRSDIYLRECHIWCQLVIYIYIYILGRQYHNITVTSYCTVDSTLLRMVKSVVY